MAAWNLLADGWDYLRDLAPVLRPLGVTGLVLIFSTLPMADLLDLAAQSSRDRALTRAVVSRSDFEGSCLLAIVRNSACAHAEPRSRCPEPYTRKEILEERFTALIEKVSFPTPACRKTAGKCFSRRWLK